MFSFQCLLGLLAFYDDCTNQRCYFTSLSVFEIEGTLRQQKLYRKSGTLIGSFYLNHQRTTSGNTVFTDLEDMAGKPEAVSLEPEIVSKKGKIPSREVNETHLKVTRPKSSKVTEKSKAERKQKGRQDEKNTASTCSSEKAHCINGAKIVSEPTSATADSPKSSLQDTLVATMKAGFNQLTNILLEEKAQTRRKRPAISDSDDMSDSEEIKSIQAKRSRVSDSGPVSDLEGDINSLIQQSTSLPEPSLGEENEILGAVVQEYDLEEKCGPPVNEKLAAIVNKMARSKLADDKLKEKLTQYTRPKNCEN